MIVYEEDWLVPLIFRSKGSVFIRASLYAAPAAILGVFIFYLGDQNALDGDDIDIRGVTASQIWGATTAATFFLLFFRTHQSLARFWEGTTLLHQMRGEWFDTVSNCVTFSISAKRTKAHEVTIFRHCLVRLMSLTHKSALEEIADYQVEVPAIDVMGLDAVTLAHVKDCHENYDFNKVETLLHLIQGLITKAHVDGVLDVPAPILSRVYQTISRGFVNLLNAKKITDTQFPFPYAQLTCSLLLLLMFITPILLSAVVKNPAFVLILTFVPLFGLFSLYLIASELDNPFGVDDNDLPLCHFQSEMNNCLMMLLHKNTDMISGLNPNASMDFKQNWEVFNGVGQAAAAPRPRRLSHVEACTLRCTTPAPPEQSGKMSPINSEERLSSSSSVNEYI